MIGGMGWSERPVFCCSPAIMEESKKCKVAFSHFFFSLFWAHASASEFHAQEVISSFCSQNVKGMSGDNDNGSDDVEV
jgi:hypothetical protein